MCLTQSQLESHNEWTGFADMSGRRFPIHGWLGVPLKDGQGTNLGLVDLSDKYGEEEFTKTDGEILVQLAEMASIAIENCRLSESLYREREQWTTANADLQQFVYSVSHDLQEPIRMIVAYSELLVRGCGGPRK
jgi:GAF domain-containing protein